MPPASLPPGRTSRTPARRRRSPPSWSGPPTRSSGNLSANTKLDNPHAAGERSPVAGVLSSQEHRRVCLRPVSIPKGFLSHCLGPHIVAVGRIKGGDVPWERLRILDKQERVVREIRGTGIFAVEFRELTGKPPKELYVSSFDGETRYCAKIIVS